MWDLAGPDQLQLDTGRKRDTIIPFLFITWDVFRGRLGECPIGVDQSAS